MAGRDRLMVRGGNEKQLRVLAELVQKRCWAVFKSPLHPWKHTDPGKIVKMPIKNAVGFQLFLKTYPAELWKLLESR